MNRSERRAAERKANKTASSLLFNPAASVGQAPSPPCDPQIATLREFPEPARLAANQANAQLSTGPRTEEGKAKVSLNAVKTALTGHTVLLPSDDAVKYEHYISKYQNRFKPVGVEEETLVQSITDTLWRMLRIPSLEAALYAKGCLEFADAFNHRPFAERPALIQAEILLKYEKQLRNLHIQENRLGRRREKELIELGRLQEARLADAKEAAKESLKASAEVRPVAPSKVGFEFSTTQTRESLDQCMVACTAPELASVAQTA